MRKHSRTRKIFRASEPVDQQQVCRSKLFFATLSEAERYRETLRTVPEIYQCPECYGFHFTTQPTPPR